MNKNRSGLIAVYAVVILTVIMGCDSDTPTGGGTPMPMPYQEEAEQVALYYSGEYTPPMPLAARISSELYAIRNSLGKQIPEINRPFTMPWNPYVVSTGWTDTAAALIADSAYAPLDNLTAHFDLTYIQWTVWPRHVTLVSPRPVNPWMLADSVRNTPGIIYAEIDQRPLPWGYYFVRAESRHGTDYFYWIEHCPELWGRLLWIEVRGGEAELKGEHYECPLDANAMWDPTLPWLVNYERFEKWIADAEANRPAWVDKARSEFAKLSIFGPHHEFENR